MLDVVDCKDLLKHCSFAASDLQRLPGYSPESVNICSMIDNHVKLDAKVDQLACSLEELSKTSKLSSGQQQSDLTCSDTLYIKECMSALKLKLDELDTAKLSVDLKNVEVKLDELHTLISSEAIKSREARNTRPATAGSGVDRSQNLIIHGIKEDRDSVVWRIKVDDILEYVAGRAVGVSDMFRLGGRYAVGKCRPVLVKLQTVWDHKIVLSNCHKLTNYGDRVSVAPDEPIDVRRRRVFDRLKEKAERNGSVVVIDNGVLIVDNAKVYSMKDGPVRNG